MLRRQVHWLFTTIFFLIAVACTPILPTTPETGGSIPSGSTPVDTPAPTTGSETEELTLYIAPERVDCVGVAPQQCLQVKESAADEYELFYQGIDGFVFVPGYLYELRVQRMERENPPADASRYLYSLIEVVSRTPAYSGESVALQATEWNLVAFGDEDMVIYQPELAQITANFTDQSLTGSAGCNQYNADYELLAGRAPGATEGSLSIATVAATRMLCPEDVMAAESAYLAALESASTFQIEGNMLTVVYAAGQLTFEAVQTAAADPSVVEDESVVTLQGSEWNLVTFGDEATVAYEPEQAPITANFADGQIAGNAGCNQYSADYEVVNESDAASTQGTLSIGLAISTQMFCGEEVMAAESAYLTALESANDFQIEGDLLTISYAAGELTFTAATDGTAGGTGEGMPTNTVCRFAGTGATLAFEGKRANFTCDAEDVALIGDVERGPNGWLIEKATLTRNDGSFAVAASQMALILQIQLADGTRCDWAGSGATLSFAGKRVNFTCDAEDVVLIGDITAGAEGWLIEKATLAHDDSGFRIAASVATPIAALMVE